MIIWGKSTPALDLPNNSHTFLSRRPVLRHLLIFLGQFYLLPLWLIDFIEAEDVLGPISIILISECSVLGLGIVGYFKADDQWLLLYETLKDEDLRVLLTASEKVILEGDLIVRAIYEKSVELNLVIRASLQPFDDLYRQCLKLHLIFCEEVNASLLLPLKDGIHRKFIILNFLLQGQREEG